MSQRTRWVRALVCSAPVGLAATAAAQERKVVDQNFDTGTPPVYTYNYQYAGGRDNAPAPGEPQPPEENLASNATSSNVTSGFGNGGAGNALTVFGNFGNVPVKTSYNYAGFGGGFGTFFGPLNGAQPPLPSANLADYRVSVDLQAGGLVNPTGPVNVEVQFQLPDDTFGPDGDTNNDGFFMVTRGVRVSPDYSTFTFTLDQGTLVWDGSVPAAERDIAKNLSRIGSINMNFNADSWGDWGGDDSNTLSIDNVVVSVVPEPAGMGLLLGTGVAGLALRRRGAGR